MTTGKFLRVRTILSVDNTGIPLRYHRNDSVVVFRYYQHYQRLYVTISQTWLTPEWYPLTQKYICGITPLGSLLPHWQVPNVSLPGNDSRVHCGYNRIGHPYRSLSWQIGCPTCCHTKNGVYHFILTRIVCLRFNCFQTRWSQSR